MRLDAIPGVSSATFSDMSPMEGLEHRASHFRKTILKAYPGLHQLCCPAYFETYGTHFSPVAIFQLSTRPAPLSQSLTRPRLATASGTKTPSEDTSR